MKPIKRKTSKLYSKNIAVGSTPTDGTTLSPRGVGSLSTVVAKVVRTSLAALERTLQRVPDLNVIFYARDPRAMALSRHVADLAFYSKCDPRHSVVDEARLLCVQMRDVLASLKRLERKYPGRSSDFATRTLFEILS